MRERQSYVLNEIANALASGYKYILLEAPTGFGKSPVAIAVGRTLGTSYICTSTKDLQTQYARDFPFVKLAKGKNNFSCEVKDDFVRNGTYKCGLCVSDNVDECYHTNADYGPCMSNADFEGLGCKYRTFLKDYKISNKGTPEEKVFIDYHTMEHQRETYSQWLYLKNLREELRVWRPCEYFDQLNIASASSHSILNYPIFLALLPNKKVLPSRELFDVEGIDSSPYSLDESKLVSSSL
jgi:Rad3-related DNA helicase